MIDALVRRSECVPFFSRRRPIAETHSSTSRAYCLPRTHWDGTMDPAWESVVVDSSTTPLKPCQQACTGGSHKPKLNGPISVFCCTTNYCTRADLGTDDRKGRVRFRAVLTPDNGLKTYTDDSLSGLGVRSQGGAKTFVVVHSPMRECTTIGRFPTISLSEARTEAKRILAEATLGKHQPKTVTFRDEVSPLSTTSGQF